MTVFFISLYLKIYKNADLGVAGKILGLAHDVGTQLCNKNGLALDFLLFLIILKCSGRKTLQD